MGFSRLPKILVLNLKRFKNHRILQYGSNYYSGGSQKITAFIDFPFENLDMTDYVIGSKDRQEKYIYDLVSVSNHYGSLGGGHYKACAFNTHFKKWFEFDDSSVDNASSNTIRSEAAYVLVYRRREDQ